MRVSRNPSILVLFLSLILGACTNLPGSPTATTNYNHSYDFSHVHKIAIQPIPRDTVETMLTSDAQIKRNNQALTMELQRRGFEVVATNAAADIFLSWTFVPKESDTVSTFDPGTQKISEAMLYVSMIDPVSLQAVWRATFHADLGDQPETPAAVEYRKKAAEVILAQFPPKA